MCGDLLEETFMKNPKLNPSRSLPYSSSSRVLVLMLLIASPTLAQEKDSTAPSAQKNAEQRAELNLQAARQNPLQLRHFLLGMPKGGDLHNHLSGAVYAESWIRAGAEDHLCVDIAKLAFVKLQAASSGGGRSEEHTSELQSRQYLVCRLLLEKKKAIACNSTLTI